MPIRISIGNLASHLLVGAEILYCGILSRSHLKKGQKMYLPLGGAAELTTEGQELLEKWYGASEFHKSAEGRIDARFVVADEAAEPALQFFEKPDPRYFEGDPLREIREELSEEDYPGVCGPILTPEEAATIQIEHELVVRQRPPSSGKGTSSLEKEGLQTKRLFHIFHVHVPSREILKKLVESPAFRILSNGEVSTTELGTKKGVTNDGIAIADNFFDYAYVAMFDN